MYYCVYEITHMYVHTRIYIALILFICIYIINTKVYWFTKQENTIDHT